MSLEKPLQKPPLTDSQLDQRAQEELASRAERIERLSAKVDQLFPGEKAEPLREKIKASFNVPQWGDFHNEGVFMDTHLDLILQNLNQVRAGEMPETLPADVRTIMQETASSQEAVLEKYVFLHDIAKMDTLLVKTKNADGKAVNTKVSWDEWQSRVPVEAQTDPVAMRAWLIASGIEGVSYYHPSDKTNEGKMHGAAGAEEARRLEAEVDPSVLAAIENHEVAYQFAKPKAETYRKYFSAMSEEEKAMALTASYIDTLASLGKTGEPNLSNFIALTVSKRNDELLVAVEAELPTLKDLDLKKVEKKIADLKKADSAFPEKNAAQLIECIMKECKKTSYDPVVLAAMLKEVKELTEDEKTQIIALVSSKNPEDTEKIGSMFKDKMRYISRPLKASEKKG